MKRFMSMAIAGACLFAPTPQAIAQSNGTAEEHVTLAQWSSRVTRALEHGLSYPPGLFGRASNEGVVTVKFNCSDNGSPAAVALEKSSGSRDLDAAALRAVSHIATLHPLPDGIIHGQKFLALVLFATSEDSKDFFMKRISKEMALRNAWFGKNAELTSVGIVPAYSR
ncbi:energy transducer TonB family protein [Rhizorhabdus argentea]|uniref:energy transducer TonB family protein n=1 Tax=Rhizorhabdus argentea TaxID=1387174 RepID=UPI0030EC227B